MHSLHPEPVGGGEQLPGWFPFKPHWERLFLWNCGLGKPFPAQTGYQAWDTEPRLHV